MTNININIKEAAKIAKISHRTIQGWARNGKFLALKVGQGWVIDRESFMRFLSSRNRAAETKRIVEMEKAIAHANQLVFSAYEKLVAQKQTFSALAKQHETQIFMLRKELQDEKDGPGLCLFQ